MEATKKDKKFIVTWAASADLSIQHNEVVYAKTGIEAWNLFTKQNPTKYAVGCVETKL